MDCALDVKRALDRRQKVHRLAHIFVAIFGQLHMKVSAPKSSAGIVQRFNRASRKDLIQTLMTLGEKFDYAASNEVLKRQIEHCLTHPKKKVERLDAGRNSVIYDLCRVIFLVSLLTAVFLTVVWVVLTYLSRRRVYCEESSDSKCIPCPVHAVCNGTRAKCLGNRTLFNKYCVEDGVEQKKIAKMLSMSVEVLERRAGRYHCQQAKTDWMSTDQLDNVLFQKFQSPDYQKQFEKVVGYLKEQPNVIVKEIEGTEVFVTDEYKMGVRCMIQRTVFRHKVLSFGVLVFLLVFPVVTHLIRTELRRRRLGEKCAANLLVEMKQMRKGQYSKQQLMRQIEKYAGNRTERVWPYVERVIVKSRNVQKTVANGQTAFHYYSNSNLK